ncbi:MAG: alkaline phosphatase family protein [candidate division KSB1 bacterium]|nr:alkaline phosphatase family protein [candidate division KSB1 bacterium]MDZ7275633.1 alkaline phosphatase family protein [candidate division KSB1 bacterium]MDZ7284676.1 alkaline phosphatase family protein [candidate division KSB1 bacterium]MDZ7297905.1 alkaline phosphatase family protein [candidate division KSB1 bacterium]MDZ7305967.1 alkaline phosphatase family protein [candidate division KSB1 bacterium]
MTATAPRILVFGMDGATWRILRPLLAQGRLPNLQRLCDAGSAGVLHSLEPMVSPAIWTSIASGKTPDKHGVWDFVVSSKSVRCKRIWDMAAESGLRIGLCGYMVTWPPPTLPGFVIPGSFSRGPETHPAALQVIRELDMTQRSDGKRSLADHLRRAWQSYRLGVRPLTFLDAAWTLARTRLQRDDLEKFYQMRRLGFAVYSDVFRKQVQHYQAELAMYVFTLVDSTSHNYWKFMEPERFQDVPAPEIRRHGGKIQQAYITVDRMIGRTLAALDRGETNVLVVSDHGFQSVPEAQGRTPDRTVRILPEALIELLGWPAAQVRSFNIRGATFFRHRQEQPAQVAKMHADLTAIHLTPAETPLFAVKPDPYGNLELSLSPAIGDLHGLQVKLPNGRVIPVERIVAGDLGTISGDHHREGILIAAGPAIRRGATLSQASVLDITPTLLALLGLPVGRDMDGRVLTEMLTPDFLAASPVRYRGTWEEPDWSYEEDTAAADETLKEHLRSLGYL